MYHSIKDIINISDEENKPFWQVVMESDMQERGVTADISYAAMEKLYAAMNEVLTPDEKNILCWRYGLNNERKKTQRDISKILGISRSYV